LGGKEVFFENFFAVNDVPSLVGAPLPAGRVFDKRFLLVYNENRGVFYEA
jgi:hypothetical protein